MRSGLRELRHAEPERRLAVVREALRFAIEASDYLEVIEGQAAIAAAAVVAASIDGGGRASDAGRSRSWKRTFRRPPAEDTELARLALARVVGGHSEWRELWEETADLTRALAADAEVRAALDRPVRAREMTGRPACAG
jgi:Domain of unknown function (DUF4259)